MTDLQNSTSVRFINLAKGHPNPTLFPLSQLHNAFETAAKKKESATLMMQYGSRQGNARLRYQIAQWDAQKASRETLTSTADEVLITNGSSAAISLICRLFTKPGDIIFAESPGYFLCYPIFADMGLKIVEIPTDEHGMNVDCVEEKLLEGIRPSMLYTVPIAQNPTGVSMSENRKKKIVQLSRDYSFKIAADEVYRFLAWTSEQPTSLYEFDDPQLPTVLSLNSFSKIIGPGLRLGWVTSNKIHIARLLKCGSLQSGGGFNPFASEIVSQMMDSGFVDLHLERLRTYYAMTANVLCDAIEKYVSPALRDGEKIRYYKPTGGFFCFLELPPRFNADNLLGLAEKHGISFLVGKQCCPEKKKFLNCIRLCFAFEDEQQITEGIRRLGKAIQVY